MPKAELCRSGSNFSFILRLRNTAELKFVLKTMTRKWNDATPEGTAGEAVGVRWEKEKS